MSLLLLEVGSEGSGVPAPPVNTVPPSITGISNIGQVQTVVPGTYTGTVTSVSYIWYSNSVQVGTGTTYTTNTTTDTGATITVKETATGPGGSTPATSTGVVIFSPSQLTNFKASVLVSLARALGGYLWQDTAQTIPAVGAGDPVRVYVDPLSGVVFTAPSSAARPTLTNPSGSLWGLLGDGVESELDSAAFSRTQPNTLGVSYRWQVSTATLNTMNTGLCSGITTLMGGLRWVFTSGLQACCDAGGGTGPYDTTIGGLTNGVTIALFDGASTSIQSNANPPIVGSSGSDIASGVRMFCQPTSGTDNTSTDFSNAIFYGLVIANSALTGPQTAALEAFLAALHP